DRPFGALTLEDLVGRVKQRRPAIVKAIPLSLSPAEPGGAILTSNVPEEVVPEPLPEEPSAEMTPAFPQEPEELPPLPPLPVAAPAASARPAPYPVDDRDVRGPLPRDGRIRADFPELFAPGGKRDGVGEAYDRAADRRSRRAGNSCGPGGSGGRDCDAGSRGSDRRA